MSSTALMCTNALGFGWHTLLLCREINYAQRSGGALATENSPRDKYSVIFAFAFLPGSGKQILAGTSKHQFGEINLKHVSLNMVKSFTNLVLFI